MNYSDLYLENIKLPKEAFAKAKKEGDYQQEEDQRPAFMHKMSGAGIKHGISINYANKALKKIAPKKQSWKDYILAEIDQNPILAASADACIYDWPNIAVYLWTNNEEEVPVLMSEASKAIRKLAGGGKAAKLNEDMQNAMDDNDVDEYVELFVELIGTGSTKEIELAFEGAKTMLENEFQEDEPNLAGLMAAMAVATMRIGTKPLKDFDFVKGFAKEMDDEFHDDFIMALQIFYQEFMYSGNDWVASKELVKRYYDNISEVMKIYGYKVKKMAIMTIIFLFYNDAVEGIGYDSYVDDEDYRDIEWPYTDTDLRFWEKFDPDTITGLKTGKGGYNL